MPTWSNLFTGYDVYADVFAAYPTIYSDLSVGLHLVDLFIDMLTQFPYDLRIFFVMFFSSISNLVILAAFLFTFFMPFLKRPQRW